MRLADPFLLLILFQQQCRYFRLVPEPRMAVSTPSLLQNPDTMCAMYHKDFRSCSAFPVHDHIRTSRIGVTRG